MPIEKVIRIIARFLVVAIFVLHVATRLLFAEASHGADLPITVILLLSLTTVWRETVKTEKNSNRKKP